MAQKYILVVDGEQTRYKYNLYRTFEHEDGTVAPDSRAAEGDSLPEFLVDLQKVVTEK